jgi:hypothetical protein
LLLLQPSQETRTAACCYWGCCHLQADRQPLLIKQRDSLLLLLLVHLPTRLYIAWWCDVLLLLLLLGPIRLLQLLQVHSSLMLLLLLPPLRKAWQPCLHCCQCIWACWC